MDCSPFSLLCKTERRTHFEAGPAFYSVCTQCIIQYVFDQGCAVTQSNNANCYQYKQTMLCFCGKCPLGAWLRSATFHLGLKPHLNLSPKARVYKHNLVPIWAVLWRCKVLNCVSVCTRDRDRMCNFFLHSGNTRFLFSPLFLEGSLLLRLLEKMQMCRLFVKAPGEKAQAVVTISISRKTGNLCL